MSFSPIRIAIVGFGKIARDQHVPTVNASDSFELVAVASPHSTLEGTPSYSDVHALLDSQPDIDAVAICTTPQVRFEVARHVLERGKHVLLEKPPGMTVSEVLVLARLAERRGLTLFSSWHSRHAAAVDAARKWLSGRTVKGGQVTWKEDVRVWHPGQKWIWQAGGLGVFDPGINALSILTQILPDRLAIEDAELSYPTNCQTPIAARLTLTGRGSVRVYMDLDFLQTGPQTWDIVLETDSGVLELSRGGTVLRVNGELVDVPTVPEYVTLYAHFAALVREARSDVDLAPLQLVADAFLRGRRIAVAEFIE